jgi:hypothetical protein
MALNAGFGFLDFSPVRETLEHVLGNTQVDRVFLSQVVHGILPLFKYVAVAIAAGIGFDELGEMKKFCFGLYRGL